MVLVYPGPAEKLKEHAEDFISGKGLPPDFLFVTDPEMKFVSAWGLRWNAERETAYPSTFIVDREGKIRFARISKTHGDRASVSEVLRALKGER